MRIMNTFQVSLSVQDGGQGVGRGPCWETKSQHPPKPSHHMPTLPPSPSSHHCARMRGRMAKGTPGAGFSDGKWAKFRVHAERVSPLRLENQCELAGQPQTRDRQGEGRTPGACQGPSSKARGPAQLGHASGWKGTVPAKDD